MSPGGKIEVAPNKFLCIAQFHSWPQMTFAKKMNAKALFLFKIWPKNGEISTHLKKLPLTIYEMLLNVIPNEMPFKLFLLSLQYFMEPADYEA